MIIKLIPLGSSEIIREEIIYIFNIKIDLRDSPVYIERYNEN